MRKLARCYYSGAGVKHDPAQAAVWLQKAADLGDAAAKATLGGFLLDGNARAGVAKNPARGFELLRDAVEQGEGLALYLVAECYLFGQGVEKDAAQGVSLMRQVVNQEDAVKSDAEIALAYCYYEGEGVEADTVQAAKWCQRAAQGRAVQVDPLKPILKAREVSA
jgi:TPR repeat protein